MSTLSLGGGTPPGGLPRYHSQAVGKYLMPQSIIRVNSLAGTRK